MGALRRRRLTAPMVTNGPLDGEMFLAYVRQFLCPTLQPGDTVIPCLSHDWENQNSTRFARATLKDRTYQFAWAGDG